MIFSLFKKKTAPEPEKPLEELLAEAKTLAQSGNYQAALAIWGPLAHQGVARAANNIGACFMGGLGVEEDLPLGLRWLNVAAEGGDAAGMRNLAAAYFQGKGQGQGQGQGQDLAQDYQAALDWYRKAAEAGDAEAQDMASWMLLEGEIVATEPVEARKWAEAAANAGIASAMTRMGMIYHNALGVARDAKQATEWWAKGVEAGDVDAMSMLGAANHLGQGVEQDNFRAMVLLIMAREGGSQLAGTFFNVVKDSLPDAAYEGARQMAEELRQKNHDQGGKTAP